MSATLEIDDAAYRELLTKSLPRPIRTDEEHQRLTTQLLELDERESRTPEEDALAEVLTLLIEDYEDKHYPMPRVSPHDSLRALMEERGLKHKDVWPVIGNKGAATEVLAGPSARRRRNGWRISSASRSICSSEVQVSPAATPA